MEISQRKLIAGFILIFLLGVMFSIVSSDYTEETDESLPGIVYLISFVSLLVGLFISMLFQWKINKVQLKRILKVLPQDEEKIITLLIENNNSLEQNKLVAFTGINKVKMSRILKELENRSVIKKMNLGNTNLIVFNKS